MHSTAWSVERQPSNIGIRAWLDRFVYCQPSLLCGSDTRDHVIPLGYGSLIRSNIHLIWISIKDAFTVHLLETIFRARSAHSRPGFSRLKCSNASGYESRRRLLQVTSLRFSIVMRQTQDEYNTSRNHSAESSNSFNCKWYFEWYRNVNYFRKGSIVRM